VGGVGGGGETTEFEFPVKTKMATKATTTNRRTLAEFLFPAPFAADSANAADAIQAVEQKI